MVYVDHGNFHDVLRVLSKEKCLGFDTETTGLRWFDNDKLFSVQFANATDEYYFDFNNVLTPDYMHILGIELFANPEILWFIANAKFDLHMLAREGIEIAGTVHCTQAIARVVNNIEPKCGLDALAKRYLGGAKLDVKTYIYDNGLFTKVAKLGNPLRGYEERLHYNLVPLNLMVPYACEDARIVYALAQWQLKKLAEIEEVTFKNVSTTFQASIWNVVNQEYQLTKTAFAMEQRGIKIDPTYCQSAYDFEITSYKECQRELDLLNCAPFDAQSPHALARLFEKEKIPCGTTAKGNKSFDKTVLESSDNPVCKTILKFRSHYKRAHTYFENFLWLADKNNVLHASINQGGARTGRVSYFEPNLQNLPKRAEKKSAEIDETGSPYPIRKSFIPRSGFFFASQDFDQMEYRLMLDYAGETAVITQVLDGMDVHTATANMMGISDRDQAKTLNFMLLYGGGVSTLAESLHRPVHEAKILREKYFASLPYVTGFKNKVIRTAENRGYLFNWLGRVYQHDRNSSYKAPNHLIQGGCGDIVKKAMNTAHAYLKGKQSALCVQIHDELLTEVHDSEKFVVQDILKIMETSFPQKVLPLTVGSAYSYMSWGALNEGIPTRD